MPLPMEDLLSMTDYLYNLFLTSVFTLRSSATGSEGKRQRGLSVGFEAPEGSL